MDTTTTTLLDGTSVLADPDLQEHTAKAGSLAVRGFFKWVTFEVLGHAVLATLCTGTSYVLFQYILNVENINVNLLPHVLIGMVLGVILVARIVNGSQQATSAAGSVIAFASTLRTVAMLSCNVSETLTINAGADHEKKATTKFRYELVRLLNLSFYCYTLMLKGLKLVTPPASLIPLEGGVMEAEVLSVVSCPTAMVCKWITSLLEEQRQAARITDQQVSVMTTELIKLMKVYQDTHGLQFTPMPAMLNGFSYFFVVVWVYSMAPVIAMMEMHDNGDLNNEGFGLGLAFSFFLALFYFGLYEAGKIIELPLAGVVDLLPIDEMGHTLSDDLSNLVDDPNDEVPVFLPRPPDARNGKRHTMYMYTLLLLAMSNPLPPPPCGSRSSPATMKAPARLFRLSDWYGDDWDHKKPIGDAAWVSPWAKAHFKLRQQEIEIEQCEFLLSAAVEAEDYAEAGGLQTRVERLRSQHPIIPREERLAEALEDGNYELAAIFQQDLDAVKTNLGLPKFVVGQAVEHSHREGLRGVVIDVDLQCSKGAGWVRAAGCLERGCALGYPADETEESEAWSCQPFYTVLPSLEGMEDEAAAASGLWRWRWPSELSASAVNNRDALPAPLYLSEDAVRHDAGLSEPRHPELPRLFGGHESSPHRGRVYRPAPRLRFWQQARAKELEQARSRAARASLGSKNPYSNMG